VGMLILRILLLAAMGASGYFLAQQMISSPRMPLGNGRGTGPRTAGHLSGTGHPAGSSQSYHRRGDRFSPGIDAGQRSHQLFLSGILEGLGIQFSGYFLINSALGYLGLILGLKKGKEFDPARLPWLAKTDGAGCDGHKVLDTSVIIDGRIADICDTGFIEGTFIIPQFILQELQHIADSSDPLKRGRGRRGLDVLNRIQKQSNLEVKIVDQDYPRIQEVDAKLIALAKDIQAKIVTNDFNLNKVAELQGIPVLNINQLFNASNPCSARRSDERENPEGRERARAGGRLSG